MKNDCGQETRLMRFTHKLKTFFGLTPWRASCLPLVGRTNLNWNAKQGKVQFLWKFLFVKFFFFCRGWIFLWVTQRYFLSKYCWYLIHFALPFAFCSSVRVFLLLIILRWWIKKKPRTIEVMFNVSQQQIMVKQMKITLSLELLVQANQLQCYTKFSKLIMNEQTINSMHFSWVK